MNKEEQSEILFKVLKIRDWSVKFQINDTKFLWYTEVDEYDPYYDTGVLVVFEHNECGKYHLVDIGQDGGQLYMSIPVFGYGNRRSRTRKSYQKDIINALLDNGYTLENVIVLAQNIKDVNIHE